MILAIMVMKKKSARINPRKYTFHVKHPFVIALIHREHENNVLFQGKVSNP